MNDRIHNKSSRKPRILLVDDNRKFAEGIRRFLEENGFDVDIGSYGLTALKKLLNNQYDVMITDIAMPEMSGDALVRKAREAGITLPIIICAASNVRFEGDEAIFWCSEYHVRLERHLFDSLIMKPFHWEDLLASISSVLDLQVFK